MSGKHSWWIRTSQTVAVFAWSTKTYVVLHYPDGTLCIFSGSILNASLSTAFSWSNGKQYLLELSFGFMEGTPLIEDSFPIPPHTQHHVSLEEDWPLVGSGSFYLPHNLFHSTLLCSIHFLSPITICFKSKTFSLCLSRESHIEILPWFFSLTWNPDIKAINITKLVQMTFSAGFGCFEYGLKLIVFK